eukprot:6050825-Prymnesium_polylepis.1
MRRDVPVGRGRHEAGLDAAAHVDVVGRPELVGQHPIRHAAIDLSDDGELGELHDAGVQHVQ